MMETGFIVSPLDELGSIPSLLDNLPPFIEEENCRHHRSGRNSSRRRRRPEFPNVREVRSSNLLNRMRWEVETEWGISTRKQAKHVVDDGEVELSFEEAMAYLDEMAGQQNSGQAINHHPNSESATSDEPSGEIGASE